MGESISGCIALWVFFLIGKRNEEKYLRLYCIMDKKNVLQKGMRKSISNFNIKVLTGEVVLHYG